MKETGKNGERFDTIAGMDSGVPDVRGHYLRIADELRVDIVTGRLPVGQTLPSYHAISTHYGVSVATAQRAVGVLRGEGFVVSVSGRGSFVVTRSPSGGDATQRLLREILTRLDTLGTEVARLRKEARR